MNFYTPGQIIDGYKMHGQNLYYLITNFEIVKLFNYLVDYMAWFLILIFIAMSLYYLVFWTLKESTRFIAIKITGKTDSHGSAKWLTVFELWRKDMLVTKNYMGEGVVLGKITLFGIFEFFIINKKIHTFLLAPTRSGKGTGSIITTILTYLGSMLINDPKGELYCITQRERREAGDRVELLDPFGMVKGHYDAGDTQNVSEEQAISKQFNPFHCLNIKNKGCFSSVQGLINAICINTSGKEDFFDKQAKAYLTTASLYLIECRDKGIDVGYPATLPGVRDFLSLNTHDLILHAEKMLESTVPAIKNGGAEMIKTYAGGEGEKVWSSIMTSISSYVSLLLDDERVRWFLSDHTCSLHSMRYIHTSVYYVSPPKEFIQGVILSRLVYADALAWVQEAHESVKGMKKIKQNILYVMDEFASLQKFTIIQNAMSIMMGLGVTLFIICQEVSQMKEHYKEGWKTFPSNSTSLFLGAGELESQEYVSKSLGNQTVMHKSVGDKGKITETEVARPLLTPDEVKKTGSAHPIALIGQSSPARLDQIEYFRIPWLKAKADKNPYRED